MSSSIQKELANFYAAGTVLGVLDTRDNSIICDYCIDLIPADELAQDRYQEITETTEETTCSNCHEAL